MSNQQSLISKKQLEQEIIKCGRDPYYFIYNYVKISHPTKGTIPFKLFQFQKETLEKFDNYRLNIVLKARQLGITTLIAAYCVWMMLFYKDRNILVLSTKLNKAKVLVKKAKEIYKNLPKIIKFSSLNVDNRQSFELNNGSQIAASSTTTDAGRAESLSLLVIDEAAVIENMDEIWTAIYPTLSTGGKCIAASTPFGVGNWFHKTYIDAESKTNDFNFTRLMWDVHPERDYEWFEKETRNMDHRQIAQELLCDFLSSGETVFSSDNIKRIEENIKEPMYKTGFDRNFWIWEEYKPGNVYTLNADVSRGDGQDYSTFQLIKTNTMEVVGEYQGKITPDLFGTLLFNVGQQYGNCMIVVENNTIGFAVLEKLKNDNYPNIFYSAKTTHEYIDPYEAEQMSSAVAGFTTSVKTRPLIIAKLEEYVRNNIIKIYSSRLLNEMTTFIWNNGKPECMKGYNDDLIMSLAIGIWVASTSLVIDKREVEYKKSFLNSMKRTSMTIDTTLPDMLQSPKPGNYNLKKRHDEFMAQNKEFLWIYKG